MWNKKNNISEYSLFSYISFLACFYLASKYHILFVDRKMLILNSFQYLLGVNTTYS